jgi:biotin synthase-related radical SAM superfamily protein
LNDRWSLDVRNSAFLARAALKKSPVCTKQCSRENRPAPDFFGSGRVMANFLKKALKQLAKATITNMKVL